MDTSFGQELNGDVVATVTTQGFVFSRTSPLFQHPPSEKCLQFSPDCAICAPGVGTVRSCGGRNDKVLDVLCPVWFVPIGAFDGPLENFDEGRTGRVHNALDVGRWSL